MRCQAYATPANWWIALLSLLMSTKKRVWAISTLFLFFLPQNCIVWTKGMETSQLMDEDTQTQKGSVVGVWFTMPSGIRRRFPTYGSTIPMHVNYARAEAEATLGRSQRMLQQQQWPSARVGPGNGGSPPAILINYHVNSSLRAAITRALSCRGLTGDPGENAQPEGLLGVIHGNNRRAN